METAILVISSIVILIVSVFFYTYLKTSKEQRIVLQQQVEKILSGFADFQDQLRLEITELNNKQDRSIDSIKKEFNELKGTILSDSKQLENNYKIQSKQIIDKFTISLEELKNNNEKFRQNLTATSKMNQEIIQEELKKILQEIKAPLELE